MERYETIRQLAELIEFKRTCGQEVDELKRDNATLRKEVDSLKLWRSWVVGGASAMALVVGLFTNRIRTLLMGGR